MFSAISKDRQCRYCEAAHLACCRMLGVDPHTLEMLVTRLDGIAPERHHPLRHQVRARSAGARLADYEQLRRHGLNQSEIVEVVSMSALAVYANIIADATGMTADEMFSQF